MLETNRRHWDELVGVHLGPGGYDLTRLRAGDGWLGPIVESTLAAVVGNVAGQRVIHLQCHFGADTLTLAQRGAEVVGVDFSTPAIAAARGLARELGLSERSRFVECDLYAAPETVGEGGSFDLAFVTWGAIGWLPDIRAWARVVAFFLRAGGRLVLVEGHPAALVFDDSAPPSAEGKPGWLVPYFDRSALEFEDAVDYADPQARIANPRCYSWLHPLGDVATALLEAGFTLVSLKEHPRVAWQMFRTLEADAEGMFGWPDRPWLPLSYALVAERGPS